MTSSVSRSSPFSVAAIQVPEADTQAHAQIVAHHAADVAVLIDYIDYEKYPG